MPSKVVHVVAPDGTRHERVFDDRFTPQQILAQLRHPSTKHQIGYCSSVRRTDEDLGIDDVPHTDVTSGLVMDHADTVILVGHADGTEFVEDERIHGPSDRQVGRKHSDPQPKKGTQPPVHDSLHINAGGGK